MLALVKNNTGFAGIIGTESGINIEGVAVCIGDIVKVDKGSNHHECVGVVGVFTDKISVMGLGGTPISKLKVIEILESHTDLVVGSTVHQGYYDVREFKV